jgi:uncharacterized protein
MKKENSAIVITCIIAAVVLLIAVFAIYKFGSGVSTGNSVTVEGVSTVKALPDVISVYFSIDTTGKTSVEAKDANTEIYDRLVDALVLQGFNKTDIKTESFNVYPNTNWVNGK